MLTAIMQPTFLPWCGYFDLIDQVDTFVFLDSAQFEKQTWQQRNRIKTPTGLDWLTVPVFNTNRFGQSISEVEIKAGAFPGKHLRTLRQHYARCAYFKEYADELEKRLCSAEQHRSLVRLNVELIRWMASAFGIETPLSFASEIPGQGARSHRLVEILRQIGSESYRSPRGSIGYLAEDKAIFRHAGISVSVQTYEHPSYDQRYSPFCPGASAIDLLFNEGPAAGAILRSGRRSPEALDSLISKEGLSDEDR